MPDLPYHQSLRIENFTVFTDASFEFSPGINVFIGENGTGKTHLLKAMYAYQRFPSRKTSSVAETLQELFQTGNNLDLIRKQVPLGMDTRVQGQYGDSAWMYEARILDDGLHFKSVERAEFSRPVFIPTIEMLGHTVGFNAAYDQVVLDFDVTCQDIVQLFELQARNGPVGYDLPAELTSALGGHVDRDDSSGRFYLQSFDNRYRYPMPVVAEGIRKLASLVLLHRNGWLIPGTTLYWDEPEVNLNPKLMDELVGAILVLGRSGVQVFLTTHSYVLLKEFDLQAGRDDKVRYFCLETTKSGTVATFADELSGLAANPILDHYGSLFDRDISRAAAPRRRK